MKHCDRSELSQNEEEKLAKKEGFGRWRGEIVVRDQVFSFYENSDSQTFSVYSPKANCLQN